MTNTPIYAALAVMAVVPVFYLLAVLRDCLRHAADMARTLFEGAVEDSDPWKDRH